MVEVAEVGQHNFEKEVLKSVKPVLVDFWAPWCMPCKIITPVVKELAEELKSKMKVFKLNVDEAPEVATGLSVLNIPTLILFKDGLEAARIIGVNRKDAIEAKIREFIT